MTKHRVVCVECTEIYGERYSTEDGCPRYDGTEDSRGYLYRRNCGHGEHVHPSASSTASTQSTMPASRPLRLCDCASTTCARQRTA